jgi:hypothetical protein
MAADLIDDFLTRLSQHIPQATSQLPQLEAELRQHWGGTERTYIRKRPSADQRAAKLGHVLQQGLPMAEAWAVTGIPRRSASRLLNRPKK